MQTNGADVLSKSLKIPFEEAEKLKLAYGIGSDFKNNALLMIDNRASVARSIHLGSVFPIEAYSFKIVKLSSAKLPATWLLDCGTRQNVATVVIEK